MIISLFEPYIPQNTCNILRLSACLGIPIDIIEPTGFIFDDKRFKRALMDYIKFINYKKHLDWKEFYQWSQENNFRLVLLTTKSKTKYTNFNFSELDIIIFGRESAGVPDYVHNQVHERLTIPMQKGLRSLNISSSVAMVIGEASRQLNLI